jgi:hypothetical protein
VIQIIYIYIHKYIHICEGYTRYVGETESDNKTRVCN